MAHINPYLRFGGNARQAFEFYQACLGGELKLSVVGESPMAEHMPPEAKDNILHAVLESASGVLMGSDMMGPNGIIKGNTVALSLICTSKKEIKSLFSKLSKGGKVTDPLTEHFFGTYGALIDKFGTEWLLQMDPIPQDKA